MKLRDAAKNQRSPEQIFHHYQTEKALANRLMTASKSERLSLYSELYEELFKNVPDHPQHIKKISPEEYNAGIQMQLEIIKPYINNASVFLEIGAGDCALTFAAAKHFKEVIAIDVSETISKQDSVPENFKLVLSDGCSVPLPKQHINIAYSNQLMEHLHPDDALEQLKNLYECIAPNGCYLCITPSRLTGPHDISQHYDNVATGFHLKEYTVGELAHIFKQAGFRKIYNTIGAKGLYFRVPASLVSLLERAILMLPQKLASTVARSRLVEAIIYPRINAIK